MGIEHIAAKPGDARNCVSKIKIAGLLELLPLLLIKNFIKERAGLLVAQVGRLDPHHIAVQTQDWRSPGRNMQITGALLLHHLEQCINFCHPICSSQQLKTSYIASQPSDCQANLSKLEPGKTCPIKQCYDRFQRSKKSHILGEVKW